MTDVQNETLPPQGPTAQNTNFNIPFPESHPAASTYERDTRAELNKDREPLVAHEPVTDIPAVDHHACIRELAKELHNASPSGAATISDKILFHLDAIADPEAHDARQAELQKAEDEREAERKAIREKLKAKPEAEKV